MDKVLEISNLNKRFKENIVLKDVNFSVKEGEILALSGENGSGKSTLMKILVGLIDSYEGDIYINSTNIKKNRNTYRAKIGALIETPTFYNDFTGIENLVMLSKMYNKKIDRNSLEFAIEFAGIEEFVYQNVKTYSVGMKQKLGIASTLINSPNLLILDEPTSGLDSKSTKRFREKLKQLVATKKISVILTSHLDEDVDFLADRIIMLKKGRGYEEILVENTR